jgi:hypothetical protein
MFTPGQYFQPYSLAAMADWSVASSTAPELSFGAIVSLQTEGYWVGPRMCPQTSLGSWVRTSVSGRCARGRLTTSTRGR